MNDLETLRPEVREAVVAIDGGNGVFVNSDDGIGSEKWKVVRAELLRLTDDCARLVDCINAQPPTRRSLIDRAERAEAELAALRAKIADAPVYEIPLSKPKSEDGWVRVIESVKNERSVRGKRVRLVVEE